MEECGNQGEQVIRRVGHYLGHRATGVAYWDVGLTWHPAGLTQHVWAEPQPASSAIDRWRLHLRTWCLKRVFGAPPQVAALTAELPLNTVGALVRMPGHSSRAGLGASMMMSQDRIDWTARILSAAARLHVHDALRMVEAGEVTASGMGPDLIGDRPGMAPPVADPTPEAIDADLLIATPLEMIPFAELASTFRAFEGVRAIATPQGLVASFPVTVQDDRPERLLFEVREARRPAFGSGLSAILSLPLSAPAHLLHAIALNEAELERSSPTDMLGGWTAGEMTLRHESFLPQVLCTTELVRVLVAATARRIDWLRTVGASIIPFGWDSTRPARVLPFQRLT